MEIIPAIEKQQCDDQSNEQSFDKSLEGFSQKSRHISENTKLTSKKKKLKEMELQIKLVTNFKWFFNRSNLIL